MIEEALNNHAQAINNLAAALVEAAKINAASAQAAITAVNNAEKPKATRKKVEKVAEETPVMEAEPVELEETQPEAEPVEAEPVETALVDAPTLTFKDVTDAFMELLEKKGRDAALKVMANFAIKNKLTPEQLPVEKFQEFIDACKS